jgi:hypothetical protein
VTKQDVANTPQAARGLSTIQKKRTIATAGGTLQAVAWKDASSVRAVAFLQYLFTAELATGTNSAMCTRFIQGQSIPIVVILSRQI